MLTITRDYLIECARREYEAGNLIAQKHPGKFVSAKLLLEDGSVCAHGACLTQEDREVLMNSPEYKTPAELEARGSVISGHYKYGEGVGLIDDIMIAHDEWQRKATRKAENKFRKLIGL